MRSVHERREPLLPEDGRVLPTEGRSGSRRRRLPRRLLRRRWPWVLVAAATAVGGAGTGLPGALIFGGVATAFYAAGWGRTNAGHTSRPGRLVLLSLTGVVVGMGAMLLGGYLGGSAPVETP